MARNIYNQQMAENIAACAAAMRDSGINLITVSYYGEGDSGEIYDVTFDGKPEPNVLFGTKHIGEFVESEIAEPLIDSLHGGYENDAGGGGRVLIHSNGCVILDGYGRYEESAPAGDEAFPPSEKSRMIAEKMKQLGVESIVVNYCGAGDSGDIEEIHTSTGEDLPEALENEVRDLAYSVIDDCHCGYEINEGGNGSVTILSDGTVVWEGWNTVFDESTVVENVFLDPTVPLDQCESAIREAMWDIKSCRENLFEKFVPLTPEQDAFKRQVLASAAFEPSASSGPSFGR